MFRFLQWSGDHSYFCLSKENMEQYLFLYFYGFFGLQKGWNKFVDGLGQVCIVPSMGSRVHWRKTFNNCWSIFIVDLYLFLNACTHFSLMLIFNDVWVFSININFSLLHIFNSCWFWKIIFEKVFWRIIIIFG